jgi:diguanylate cyclase (GGDEF)-like protein
MAETALRSPSAVSNGPTASNGDRPTVSTGSAVRLARMWFAELAASGNDPATGSGALPMNDVHARDFLTAQSLALLNILFGDPFRPRHAAGVGQALVRADFVSGGVLGRSLRVLMLRLPEIVGDAWAGRLYSSSLERRIAELTEALANGYVRALRDRTLAEQESIMRAELEAERFVSEQLRHAATHDPLTGLPNRAAVFNQLEMLCRGNPATSVGLCYLDLDGFKGVNDRFGHQAGDELLVAVARRIESVTRSRGALAGRIGGDEFVVLAESFSGARWMIGLAAGILAEVNRPVPLRVGQVSISACAGLAACAAGSPAAATIVADADSALYHAKARGCGRWALFDAAWRQASLAAPAGCRASMAFRQADLPSAAGSAGAATSVRSRPRPPATMPWAVITGATVALVWSPVSVDAVLGCGPSPGTPADATTNIVMMSTASALGSSVTPGCSRTAPPRMRSAVRRRSTPSASARRGSGSSGPQPRLASCRSRRNTAARCPAVRPGCRYTVIRLPRLTAIPCKPGKSSDPDQKSL